MGRPIIDDCDDCHDVDNLMVEVKRLRDLLSRKDSELMTARWVADSKVALRREVEELLGVESGAAGDEQFQLGIERLREVLAENQRLRQANDYPGCRESVRWFAEQMEAKLTLHDDRGGWLGHDYDWLLGRLEDELFELKLAIQRRLLPFRFVREVGDRIISEAADVANFAMMIADNARAKEEK